MSADKAQAQLAGQKRPAPAEGDDISSAYDIEISDETQAKLKEASRVLLRAELANGALQTNCFFFLFSVCMQEGY